VVWRPNNLTSLGSANLNATSVKDASFVAAAVFAAVVTVAVSFGYQQGSLQLLWTGIGYCLAGIVIMLLPIVRAYARATELLSVSEAAFRGVHARFRLHSETIALYNAEAVEVEEMTRAYAGECIGGGVGGWGFDEMRDAPADDSGVAAAQRRFIVWQSTFQGLQILFRFGPTFVAVVLLKNELFKAAGLSFDAAQATLSKCIRLMRWCATVTICAATATFMFQTVLGAAFYAGAASEAAGYGSRITQLLETVGGADSDAKSGDNDDGDGDDDDSKISKESSHKNLNVSVPMVGVGEPLPPPPPPSSSSPLPPIVRLNDITITNPMGTTLLRSLSFSLNQGDSCIIVGPSGPPCPCFWASSVLQTPFRLPPSLRLRKIVAAARDGALVEAGAGQRKHHSAPSNCRRRWSFLPSPTPVRHPSQQTWHVCMYVAVTCDVLWFASGT